MLSEQMTKDMEKMHKRALDITGDYWIPYPSALFVEASLIISNDDFKSMLKARRAMSFNHFLTGDPQEEELIALIYKYDNPNS